jgi:recombination protein RecA
MSLNQRAATLEALRERIRVLEGGGLVNKRRVVSGVSVVEELVRGLPRPGILEVCGPLGSGATRIALLIAREAIARRELVAWVDWERKLYPPAAAELGVDLSAMLVVRPPSQQGTWAAEQLMRSGCFSVVVVADPLPTGKAGQRWVLAVEHGQCTAVVVRRRSSRLIPADSRLAVGDGEVTTVKDRGGRVGQSAPVPPLPPGGSPWE